MERFVSVNIPLEEFEEIQKQWIREVLSETQSQSDKEEELISRKEAAELLRISLPTLQKYTLRKIVPGYRMGIRVLYKKSEVLDSLGKIGKYRGEL